ncbi:MAG: hypothetical protein P8R54_26305 [Myxococcota bacterium]|nr:hypothetical protein [Myxococcota bacterium]
MSEWVAGGLEALNTLAARAGMPLAVASWLTLLVAVLAMHRRLSSEDTEPHRTVAGMVGGLALVSHLADGIVTLTVTPALSMETSALWVAIIDRLGEQAAMLYGLTGKALIVVLSYQLFLWYRIQRLRLFPLQDAHTLMSFSRAFGRTRLENLGNFLSFTVPLLSPLMLYVVLLNTAESPRLLTMLPPLPAVALAWLVLLTVGYFQHSYRAWRAT